MRNLPGYSSFLAADGLKINIREWGAEEGVACILLHGLADGSFVWNDFAEKLSSYCHVLALDLRGHGDSDRDLQKNYTLEAYIADVESMVGRLALRKYILIGHSLGGDIAAKVISRRPEGIIGAVFVDAGPSPDDGVRLHLHNQIIEGHKTYESIEAYVKWLSARRFLAAPEVLEQLAQNSLRRDGTGYQPKFDVEVAGILLEDDDDSWWWLTLEKFKIPILIVRGEGSAVLSRRIADRMVTSLRNGQTSTVKGAGHSVMDDNPAGFSEAVMPFLLSLLGRVV